MRNYTEKFGTVGNVAQQTGAGISDAYQGNAKRMPGKSRPNERSGAGALFGDILDIFAYPDVRITVKPCQKIDNAF